MYNNIIKYLDLRELYLYFFLSIHILYSVFYQLIIKIPLKLIQF